MKTIFDNINGKKIKEIRQEGGYDSRYDDVVITFEDGSSILIQGDFSLTTLESGQRSKEPEFYSYNPPQDGSGMPKASLARMKNHI